MSFAEETGPGPWPLAIGPPKWGPRGDRVWVSGSAKGTLGTSSNSQDPNLIGAYAVLAGVSSVLLHGFLLTELA